MGRKEDMQPKIKKNCLLDGECYTVGIIYIAEFSDKNGLKIYIGGSVAQSYKVSCSITDLK